jgi:acetyl esterase/lipase
LLAEDSASLRQARPGQLDLPFAGAAWCRWDLFPAADPNRPCLVILHGASDPGLEWRGGDRRQCSALAEGLRDHGWAAALPGRGLIPAVTPSRVVHETHKALDWLAAQGAQHGISGPVVLAGWGAGADLAALALGHPRVAAGIGICGGYDLGRGGIGATELEVAVLSPLHLPVVKKPFILAHDGAESAAASASFHALRQQHGGMGRLIALAGQGTTRLLDSLRAPDGALCRAVLELAG